MKYETLTALRMALEDRLHFKESGSVLMTNHESREEWTPRGLQRD